MTKKHFEAIAQALRLDEPKENWLNKRQQYVKDCRNVAIMLQSKNKDFKFQLFLEKCGLIGDEKALMLCNE